MTRLIFVYNAEAGLLNGLLDSIHKAVSPATYACSLCAITYGPFRMDPRWRDWLQALPFESVFHHRGDFAAAYPGIGVPLPAVLIDEGDGPKLLFGPEDIASAGDVPGLIAALDSAISKRSPSSPATPARPSSMPRRPAAPTVRDRS